MPRVGPGGKGQGHVVLTRDMAEYAHGLMLRVLMERDELVQEVARLEREGKR